MGRIATSAYLGDHLEYEIETEIGPLFAVDAEGDAPLSPGTPVALGFRPRGLALIA